MLRRNGYTGAGLKQSSHRKPMKPDADLSLRGHVRLLAEFLEALDLRDVTLVLNDWGGGQFLISERLAGRVGRLALVACEASASRGSPAA
ncbi:hydrolase, alpha/beta hydrolase fold family [Amycolatopsis methanolica 239]|uniref:Hydrolase, alpha/beta hydrolase fold family n=1 Tax=Amycolatopsis methanolica 239 TaxID=1068978 RepID=A0A076MLN2_AMYME|nr:hydrolase, alpha/beta hydrolase fold family [Amycolatopsis methanolica 239]